MNINLLSQRSLILGFLTGLIFLFSCKGDRSPILPNVTGRAGEVVVVINAPIWESESGRALGNILISEHPALPQWEPMFDIVRIGHAAFTNIFKTHRNIIIVNVSSQYNNTRMSIRKDVWAKPQILIEINAPDTDALYSFLNNQDEKILEELVFAERERIKEYNRRYEKRTIRTELKENYGLSLVFPPGYIVNVDTTDFAWIGFDPPTQDRIQGVLIYEYDYTDPDTFTPEFLVNKRNQFLRKYVPGPLSNSWMTTEIELFPLFREFMKEDRYIAELRGLWKVQNYFMGGPFVSHTTLDEKRNRVVTVEGFVFAPDDKKRNLLRQVEAILYTLEIEK